LPSSHGAMTRWRDRGPSLSWQPQERACEHRRGIMDLRGGPGSCRACVREQSLAVRKHCEGLVATVESNLHPSMMGLGSGCQQDSPTATAALAGDARLARNDAPGLHIA